MTAPKKGDCGTCHWFEGGSCLVNPPVPMMGQTEVPGSRMRNQGVPEYKPGIIGAWPATKETMRCEKWRPAGMLPELALDVVHNQTRQ